MDFCPHVCVFVRVCIRRLVTGSSPTINEVWTPVFSLPPLTPPRRLYTSPGVKAPTEVTLNTGPGKELLCNNTHTHTHTHTHTDSTGWLGLENISPSHQILWSTDYQAWTRMIKRVHFNLATVSAALVLGLFLGPPTISTLSIKQIFALLLFTDLHYPAHWLSASSPILTSTDTQSQIYLGIPAWCLFLGRISSSVLPPPFLWR